MTLRARPPMIIRTFMEAHPELADKTIIPFGTHGGSGVGSYTTLIKEYFPNATVLESLGIAGVSIRDASSRQTVENWLKKLGVDKQSTAINHVRTRCVDNGVSYTLNGMPSNNQRGLYIKNGKKYVSFEIIGTLNALNRVRHLPDGEVALQGSE